MNCLNLSLPVNYKGESTTTQAVLDDLAVTLGSKEIAYAVLSSNNGYPLTQTPAGKPSILYKRLHEATGDTIRTDRLKAKLYAPAFRKKFGEWVSNPDGGFDISNGEPRLHSLNGKDYYISKDNTAIPAITGTFTTIPSEDMHSKSQHKLVDGVASLGLGSVSLESNDSTLTLQMLNSKADEFGVPFEAATPINLANQKDKLRLLYKDYLKEIIQKEVELLSEDESNAAAGRLSGLYDSVSQEGEIGEVPLSTLVNMAFSDKKLQLDVYEAGMWDLMYFYVTALMPQSNTNGLKEIFDSLKPGAVEMVMQPKEEVKPVELGKPVGEMSDTEITNAIVKQFVPNTKGPIVVGSMVHQPTGNGGFNKAVVIAVHSDNTYDLAVLTHGLKTEKINKFLKGYPAGSMDKIGDYSIVREHKQRAVPMELLVLPNTIMNISKFFEKDPNYLNGETSADTTKYREIAAAQGLANTKGARKPDETTPALDTFIKESRAYVNGTDVGTIKQYIEDANGTGNFGVNLAHIFYTGMKVNPEVLGLIPANAPGLSYLYNGTVGNAVSTSVQDAYNMAADQYRNVQKVESVRTLKYPKVLDAILGTNTSFKIGKSLADSTIQLNDVITLGMDKARFVVRITGFKEEGTGTRFTFEEYLPPDGYNLEANPDGVRTVLSMLSEAIYKSHTGQEAANLVEMVVKVADEYTSDPDSVFEALGLIETIGNTMDSTAGKAYLAKANPDIVDVAPLFELFQRAYINNQKAIDKSKPVESTTAPAQTPPKEKVKLIVKSPEQYEFVKTMVEAAVKNGTESFITLSPDSIQKTGVDARTQDLIDYVKSRGYTEKPMPNGLMALVKLPKLPEAPKVESTVPSKDVPTTPTTAKNIVATSVFDSIKEPFHITTDDNGNITGLEVNLSKIDGKALHTLLTNNPSVSFTISDNSSESMELLISMRRENGAYPSNLVVTANTKVALLLRDTVATAKADSSGTVTIKGVAVDLVALGIDFDLSEDQVIALNSYAEWLAGDSTKPFSIEGIAGTGKTTLLRVARKYSEQIGMPSKFTALTHMATINLEMLIKDKATTLHSALKLGPSLDTSLGSELIFEAQENENPGDEPDMGILFIDEISMASDSMMELIFDDLIAEKGIRVVFIGSEAQLPPVDRAKDNANVRNKSIPVHPAFSDKVEIYKLKQVKRQSEGNPALPLLKRMSLRQSKAYTLPHFLHGELYYNPNKGEGVKAIHTDTQAFSNEMVAMFKEAYADNNYMGARVLTYSNAEADKYNQFIRKQLGYNADITIEAGEPMVLTETSVAEGSRKGLVYKVLEVKPKNEELFPGGPKATVLHVKLEPGVNFSINGESALKTITVKTIPDTPQNRAAAEEFGAHLDKLRRDAYLASFPGLKKKLTGIYLNERANYSFMFELEGATDKGKKYVQLPAGINYGYASTIHKAQGSTFTNVAIPEGKIISAISWYAKDSYKGVAHDRYNKLLYTALTRASKMALVYTGRPPLTNKYIEQGPEALKAKVEADNETMHSRVVQSDKVAYKKNSFEDKVRKLYDIIGKATEANITKISAMPVNNLVDAAIINADPSGVIVHDSSNKSITRANVRLRESIATSEDDPRINKESGFDMYTYNKGMIDLYNTAISRALRNEMTEEQAENNVEEALHIKHTAVTDNIKKEIKSLKVKHLHSKEAGASITDQQSILQDILVKEKHLGLIGKDMAHQDLVHIAQEDLERANTILDKASITDQEFQEVDSILRTWGTVSDLYDAENNPFLDRGDMVEKYVIENFGIIGARVAGYATSLDILGKDLMQQHVRTNTNLDIPVSSLGVLRNKVSWFGKGFLAISKIDNPIIASVMTMIDNSNKKAEVQALSESREIADLYEDMQDSDFDENLFWETDEGAITGKLTSEYSPDFQNLKEKAKYSKTAFSTYKAAMVMIEPAKLYKKVNRRYIVDEQAKQAYIEELTPLLGLAKATSSVNEAIAKWEEFKELRTAYGKKYTFNSEVNEDRLAEIEEWTRTNSPIQRINAYKNAKSYADLEAQGTDALAERYMVSVPRMFDGLGERTTHYSKQYEQIMASKEATAFYNKAEKVTRSAKENFGVDSMSDYALTAISRDIGDEFRSSKIGKATRQALHDKMIKQITGGFEKKSMPDPITGEEVKSVKKGVITLEQAIASEMEKLRLTSMGKYPLPGDPILPKQKKQLFAEASANVMKADKADLFMAINNLNMASLTSKYKTAVEAPVNVAMHFAAKMTPGEARGRYSREVNSEDVSKALTMTENFVNKTLYDEGAPDESYKLPVRKRYTNQEEIERKRIEEQIAYLESIGSPSPNEQEALTQLRNDLAKLGGHITMNSLVDTVINAVRYSTMGWNLQSGIANALQGQLANIIMSTEGTHFNWEDLREAYAKMANGEDRDKIRKMTANYALLGDIMYDFKKTNQFKTNAQRKNATNALLPFTLTKFSEQGNQSAIMVAMMLKQQVVDKNGESISLWEAIDKEGTLSEDYTMVSSIKNMEGKETGTTELTGVDALTSFIHKVTEKIAHTQGDYVNAKIIQNLTAGRALMMFKTWFFDPFMVRFGTERYNYILQTTTKGRFISVAEAMLDHNMNIFKLYQSYKNGELSTVDAKNLRTALMEVGTIVTLFLIKMLAEKVMCDERTGKCGKSTYAINMLKRLNGEMATFLSAKAYYDLLQNPLAISRYLKLVADTFDAGTEALTGEGLLDNDTRSKLGKRYLKELPLIRRMMIEYKLATEVSKLY